MLIEIFYNSRFISLTGDVYKPNPSDAFDLGFSPEKRRKSIELLESPSYSSRFGPVSPERIRNKEILERMELLTRGERSELQTAAEAKSRNASRRTGRESAGLLTVITPRLTALNSSLDDDTMKNVESKKVRKVVKIKPT